MPTIEFDQAKLAYFEVGGGETAVLLHSSAGSGAQWRSLSTQLADRFAVLAPDLYGYGASEPWPGRAAMTLADEVAPLEALLARRPGLVHLGRPFLRRRGRAAARPPGAHAPQPDPDRAGGVSPAALRRRR